MYLVTTVTRDRVPVFHDLFKARWLVRTMKETQARGLAETLAYVVMPEHTHWLMRLGEIKALSEVVGGVKSVSAHRVGGRVWQAGFHDHALSREEDLAGLARYVVANPLRAGLVKRLREYPHWDAVWL